MFKSDLMNINELSSMLGYSPATVRNAIKGGSFEISYFQEGPYQQYFFRKADVLEFLEGSKR